MSPAAQPSNRSTIMTLVRQLVTHVSRDCAFVGRGKCVYIRDLAYCLLLLSFRVTGARSLGFRACPPLLSRSAETRRRISRACLCATFERPAFLFLFPARDHDPFFFVSPPPFTPLSISFFSLFLSLSLSHARPFSISLAPLDRNNVHPCVCVAG